MSKNNSEFFTGMKMAIENGAMSLPLNNLVVMIRTGGKHEVSYYNTNEEVIKKIYIEKQ